MGDKAHPDVNDTLRQEGPDAVRERHDQAHTKKANGRDVTLLLEQTLNVFERWLLLKSNTPILAVLGAVAANYLAGDPVWLGLIAPPSSAKTEILNSTSLLPNVFQAATLTPAGLLSGTPKKCGLSARKADCSSKSATSALSR